MAKQLILLLGKPGSGKSTVSQCVANKLNDVYYFSIGNELREIAFNHKPSQFSISVKKYGNALKHHKPVPPELAIGVFEECVDTTSKSTVIVDGYPQYVDRLPGFYDSIEHVGGEVMAVCEIKVSDETARGRMKNRSQRLSDVAENDEYVDTRLKGYYKNAKPVAVVLAQKYPFYTIDGEQPLEDVVDALAEIIQRRLV